MCKRFHKTLTVACLIVPLFETGCTTTGQNQAERRTRTVEQRSPREQSGDSTNLKAATKTDSMPVGGMSAETSYIKRTAFENSSPESGNQPPAVDAASLPTGETSESATSPKEDTQGEVSGDGGYPLDLTTALYLTTGQNTQVALAQARIAESQAQADRAATMWLPSLRAGVNYNKHEGPIQSVAGDVFNTSRGALYTGLGANAVGAGSPGVPGLVANFHLTDAIFQPKAARNAASARGWEARAATNNELHQTAVTYLELLRAEQELAIARDAHERANQLTQLTQTYAKTGQGLQSDFERSQTELSQRVNEVQRAEEQVRVLTARLAERLRLDPFVKLLPQEVVVVPLQMVPPEASVHDLLAQGLGGRPEISESRALVAEALERLKREEYAPLIPSVLLGVSYGGFGGGLGSNISNFGSRLDGDAVAYWELRNLGAGDRAARSEANSRLEQARVKEIMALDRVAREVIEAHTQVESRRKQIATAEQGIQTALDSYDHNLERIKNAQGLPIEVLQSIQALANARRDYLRALIDFNIAQFTLYRSIGWPDAGFAM